MVVTRYAPADPSSAGRPGPAWYTITPYGASAASVIPAAPASALRRDTRIGSRFGACFEPSVRTTSTAITISGTRTATTIATTRAFMDCLGRSVVAVGSRDRQQVLDTRHAGDAGDRPPELGTRRFVWHVARHHDATA